MNTNMKLIDWVENISLPGFEVMDDYYRELVSLINETYSASDEEFISLFEKLCLQTETFFARENDLMGKSAFPAATEHEGEHKRMLDELHHFNKRVKIGLYAFGRTYIRDSIPRWLKLHTTTMDSALAAHLKLNQ